MTEPAIVVDNVSKFFRQYQDRPRSLKEGILHRGEKRYKEFWALEDVSFSIDKGEVFGFVGHNGSGKSTLLRCITGIYQPTKGRVVTHGRISALLELGAGFHPELTGRENIFMNATILGMNRSDIEPLIDDIAEFAGLRDFIDTPVKVYSSGMFVRLGFSVAVHVDPEILIIDEVIAVGDEEFQRKCFEHLYQLRRKGVTIVLVSHGLGLVQTMCDRAVWLERGKLQAIGPALQIVERYIRKVNADEEQSEVDAPTGGMAEYGRQGTGEVHVTAVDFLDGGGDQTMHAVAGEPLTIRMHYSAESVDDPHFAVSVHSDTGVHIAGEWCAENFGRLSGDGHIDFTIQQLRLNPGNYEISTSVYDGRRQHIYDRLERAFHLTVRPGGDADTFGYTKLLGTWSLNQHR